jgi:hypothetical protein
MVYRMLKDELLHAYGRRRGTHFEERIGLGVLCAAGGGGLPHTEAACHWEAIQVGMRLLIGRMFRRTKSALNLHT